jgi:hypothetical protein
MAYFYKKSLLLSLLFSGCLISYASADSSESNDQNDQYTLKNPNDYPEEDWSHIRAENLRKIREYNEAVEAAKASGKKAALPPLAWE